MELNVLIALAGFVPAALSTLASVMKLRSARDPVLSAIEIHRASGDVFRAELNDQEDVERLTDILLTEHGLRATTR